jgi:hypothetical protein
MFVVCSKYQLGRTAKPWWQLLHKAADEGTARHARVPSMDDLGDKSSPAQRGPFSTPIQGPYLKPIDSDASHREVTPE